MIEPGARWLFQDTTRAVDEPKDVDDRSGAMVVKSFRFRDNSGFERLLRITKVVADDLGTIKRKRAEQCERLVQ